MNKLTSSTTVPDNVSDHNNFNNFITQTNINQQKQKTQFFVSISKITFVHCR